MLAPIRKGKAAEVLVLLLRGPKGIREIQMAVGGSYKTIYLRIKEFSEQGLITEKYVSDSTSGRNVYATRLIKLTEKGRELAQSLINFNLMRPFQLSKLRERWIIAVLHVLGPVSGKTRLMKLLLILRKELGFNARQDFSGFYRFTSGKYGPFSRGVQDDLEELREDGFIKIKVEKFPSNQFNEGEKFLYTYELVSTDKDILKEVIENLPSNVIQKLNKLKDFNKMPLIKLLEYVYIRYPGYTKKSLIVEKVLLGESKKK